MSKKAYIYSVLIVLAFLAIVVVEMTKPKSINWFPSYATHHKIPFGSYVFNEQLKRVAYNVNTIDSPPFEYLKNNDISGTYIFYNNDISFGKAELNSILDWVFEGNTLIIGASNFEKHLLDTLNLGTKSVNIADNFNNAYQIKLVNPSLSGKNTYTYDRPTQFFHFNKIDTTHTKVIGLIDTYRGEQETMKAGLINSIKQPFGDGEIILSTFPQAFTNYFILNTPNQDYTAGLISYIDTRKPIYIDTYYKSGKTFYTSPMYLFLNNKSLKWAYYILLIGVLVYIIFEGKRKQRAIPIVHPLRNQTLDFTRTISNMYYENSKHKAIALHKIQYFLEYIRSTSYIPTSEINNSFITHLAARSNNSIEDTQTLFKFIEDLKQKSHINKKELESLNTLIDNFKSHKQWTKTKQ